MLLTVLSAMLGAWFGLTRSGKISAMLVSGAIAMSGHVVLMFLGQLLIFIASNPAPLRVLVIRLGVGQHMAEAVGAAMLSAAVAGLLSSLGRKQAASGGLYLPDLDEGLPRRRRKPARESQGPAPISMRR